jgi:hypothetical protein
MAPKKRRREVASADVHSPQRSRDDEEPGRASGHQGGGEGRARDHQGAGRPSDHDEDDSEGDGRASDQQTPGRESDDEEGRANDDKDPEVVDGGDISDGDADDIDDRSEEKQQSLAKLGMMLASYMVQIPDNTYSRQIKSKLDSLLCDVKLMESWIEVNDPESSPPGSVREILEQWDEMKDTVKNIIY